MLSKECARVSLEPDEGSVCVCVCDRDCEEGWEREFASTGSQVFSRRAAQKGRRLQEKETARGQGNASQLQVKFKQTAGIEIVSILKKLQVITSLTMRC